MAIECLSGMTKRTKMLESLPQPETSIKTQHAWLNTANSNNSNSGHDDKSHSSRVVVCFEEIDRLETCYDHVLQNQVNYFEMWQE